ncbi:MAG: glyoxalase/bleomycin resistance/extradiol dioxygenase family protein [Desulfobulbaceae bacterium]|nr:MAG: glyoxalase/bleomycin resistance/extradiol dioxygenase family protein [Desulfobulbaceae bacterium]
MKLISSYPVICTDKVKESSDFYQQHFNFEPTFAADWYVSLRSKDNTNFELALLDANHPTIPEPYRKKVSGVIINLEVEDVDTEYQRLKEQSLEFALEIKSEDFGQRHFIVVDPNGILVDVIQNIEPSAEFAEQYGS